MANDHARHICKKVELEGRSNADTIKQVIGQDKLSKNNIDENEINEYCSIIINNIDIKNIITSQMEQQLILSNVVNYVLYDKNPKFFMI